MSQPEKQGLLAMGSEKITRYVDLGRFLAMLGKWHGSPQGRLFFACPDRLGDPQEGTLGDADRQLAEIAAKARYGGARSRAFACWLSREWQDKLLTVGVSCWYLGDTESHAMWQIFGAGGVAIESTVDKVKEALDPAAVVEAKLVEYVDYPKRASTDLDPAKVLSFKRPPYQHEKELRFFVSLSETEPQLIKNLRGLGRPGEMYVHQRPQGELGANGITVPFDVVRAVDRVVLAPSAPTWLKTAILYLCVANNIDIQKVEQSRLDDDPYAGLVSGLNQHRLGCDELALPKNG
jgi:hypothetical protein